MHAAFDHICFGLNDFTHISPLLFALGGNHRGGGVNKKPPFRWLQWGFSNGGAIEALEPHGPPGSFLHRFLEARGPGFHHVTFKVKDIKAARAHAEKLGFTVVGYDDSDPFWKELFLQPKEALGIVVQIAQSARDGPPKLLAPPPSTPLTDSSGAAVGPVDCGVRGLRLVCRSEASARRQWGELLGGEGTATLSESGAPQLRFTFPNSAMQILVDIDPAARAEGPVCVEVFPRAAADLGSARSVLGAAAALPFRAPLVAIDPQSQAPSSKL